MYILRPLLTSVSTILLTSLAAAGCVQDVTSEDLGVQQEAIVGRLGNGTLDPARTTHILAIGYSDGQSNQFVRSALSRGLRYREAFPDRQIVFIGSPEVAASPDADVFRGFGLEVVSDEGGLSGERILAKMKEFSSIASFDFFGHSSPWALGVASGQPRLGTSTSSSALESVRANFTADAYATLNGCNSGYYLAPELSNYWQIPVSAALTATNFQQLHTNGKFYFNDAGLFPAGGWSRSNARSYRTARSCSQGACYRMKPDNAPYSGYWGSLAGGGLGFYEFFCNYAGAGQSCNRRMALSLYGFPSTEAADGATSRAGFERVVLDFLCPDDVKGARGASCRTGIANAMANGSQTFSSFQGNALECADAGCTFNLACGVDAAGNPAPGTCTMSAPENTRPTAIVREYKRYMQGFDQLRASQPQPQPAGGIATRTLETVNNYTVITEALNCRSGAGTDNALEQEFLEGTLLTATSTATRPRIQISSNGKSWLLVQSGARGPCYVSAQAALLRPAP